MVFCAHESTAAFRQSAWFFAVVTSPAAKAGTVNARAKANANIETRVFIGFPPYADTGGLTQRHINSLVPHSHKAGLFFYVFSVEVMCWLKGTALGQTALSAHEARTF